MDTNGTHHFAFRLRRTLAVVASLGIVVLTSVGSAEARPSRDSRSAACVISEFAPVFTFSGVIQGCSVVESGLNRGGTETPTPEESVARMT